LQAREIHGFSINVLLLGHPTLSKVVVGTVVQQP
jgi:hypothetical protein